MCKKTETGHIGPINKLPDEIIANIMKCLPLRDAAKLCLISRSWLRAWKEVPELRFDAQFISEVLKSRTPMVDEFCNILSAILLSHVGPISRIYLYIPELRSSSSPDIGPWISYLSRNDVKDITIKNVHKPPLKLSYHLFSCLNLEMLMLDNCVLNLLPDFKVLRNLKSLELECVILIGNSVRDFIANCPVLENLSLKRCKGFECMDISAPNLMYLTVSGIFKSVYIRSAEQLRNVSITLEEVVPNDESTKTDELIAYLTHLCGLENLSFGGHFCKFLTAGGIRSFPATCDWLKSLQLSNIETTDKNECMWFMWMLIKCPVLEDLIISFSSSSFSTLKFTLDPSCQFYCLREVVLSSVMGDKLQLSLIKILLRSSPALQRMFVKRDADISEVRKSRLARKLMYYSRASPEAKIVYMEP